MTWSEFLSHTGNIATGHGFQVFNNRHGKPESASRKKHQRCLDPESEGERWLREHEQQKPRQMPESGYYGMTEGEYFPKKSGDGAITLQFEQRLVRTSSVYDESLDSQIIDLRQDGKTITVIAETIGKSRRFVYRRLRELGAAERKSNCKHMDQVVRLRKECGLSALKIAAIVGISRGGVEYLIAKSEGRSGRLLRRKQSRMLKKVEPKRNVEFV